MMLAFLFRVLARATPLTRLLLLVAQQHYLIRRTVAALIHAVPGCICFHFVQYELMIIRQTASTKQPPQIRFHGVVRNNVRSSAARISADAVRRVGFRTLDAAMAP